MLYDTKRQATTSEHTHKMPITEICMLDGCVAKHARTKLEMRE